MRAPLRWAPWILLGTFGALVALVGILAVRGTLLSDTLGLLVFSGSFAFVGALVAARRPGNSMGWLCLGFALCGGSQIAAQAYATHGLITDPGSLPGAQFAAWWSGWMGTPSVIFVLMLLPLLFPTGRPPSPRWRPVLWLALTYLVVSTLTTAFSPGPLAGAPEFENPLGLEILGQVPAQAAAFFGSVSIGLFMILLLLCAASLVTRYRHAPAPERQQLKWFLYAFLLAIGTFVVGVSFSTGLSADSAAPAASPFETRAFTRSWYHVAWWSIVFPATMMTIPLAIGIAILRHRLFDIDRLINRTLVYGALTSTLAIGYLVAVGVLQAALSRFTSGSELAVAGSTLAVFALFTPLRRRIQRAVDRRFYRARYDASLTLEAFGARLRDEVDPGAVVTELLTVARETLQPVRVSLWLRGRTR
jgi:hypothetical protein